MAMCYNRDRIPEPGDVVESVNISKQSRMAMIRFRSGRQVGVHLVDDHRLKDENLTGYTNPHMPVEKESSDPVIEKLAVANKYMANMGEMDRAKLKWYEEQFQRIIDGPREFSALKTIARGALNPFGTYGKFTDECIGKEPS